MIKYAVEFNKHCIDELKKSPHSADSIFGDSEDFFLPRVKQTIYNLRSHNQVINLESLLPLIRKPHTSVGTKGYCFQHDRI